LSTGGGGVPRPPRPPIGPNRFANGFGGGLPVPVFPAGGAPKGLPPISCIAARIASGFCIICCVIWASGFWALPSDGAPAAPKGLANGLGG